MISSVMSSFLSASMMFCLAKTMVPALLRRHFLTSSKTMFMTIRVAALPSFWRYLLRLARLSLRTRSRSA